MTETKTYQISFRVANLEQVQTCEVRATSKRGARYVFMYQAPTARIVAVVEFPRSV